MSACLSAVPSLAGTEGNLVSVSVSVEPSHLEGLLDALAHLQFPINPEIYHDATAAYHHADSRGDSEPTTLVEFPAYEGHLEEIRVVLDTYGFPRACMHVTDMLDYLRSETRPGSRKMAVM